MSLTSLPGAPRKSQDNGVRLEANHSKSNGHCEPEIIDIRREPEGQTLLGDILAGLRVESGREKTLPTLLLYDEAGLRLFEKITYLEEYYLTNAEIEILETYGDRIAERIQPDSIILELGSGNLRKVNILLQALERQEKNVEYYALDLDKPELQRTLADVPSSQYKHVKFYGLHGTYDDGLEWLKTEEVKAKSKTVLSLGSSLGNFKKHEASSFLRGFADVLLSGEIMIIGIDACRRPEKVFHAYNDRHDVTHSFLLNGLRNANRLLGKELFNLDEWDGIGEYVYDRFSGRHQAFLSPMRDVLVGGIPIKKGEKIRIEESHKYSANETIQLWQAAGLAEGSKWSTKTGDYTLHMVSKPKVFYPVDPSSYAAGPVPTVSEWEGLWAAWDAVTQHMIPREELGSKPIKLRNPFIFYLGHIPTFLDIQLTRGTGGPPTEPKTYWSIFERGIDPDVDDPQKCHAHSKVPDEWPPVEEILEYQTKVRQRIKDLTISEASQSNADVRRALWLGFEHEVMHLETLLYITVQSDRTLAPPGTVVPDFEALALQATQSRVPNEWFTIPRSDITIGMDDPDGSTGPERHLGWDNEKPSRKASVESFFAKARPITNGEYAEYLDATKSSKLPAAWVGESSSNGDGTLNGAGEVPHVDSHTKLSNGLGNALQGKFVRTVYGSVPLEYALDWPVFASYDELAGCASWMGGRIPTVEEARSIYAYVDRLRAKDISKALGRTIPAVNSHLVNDGVEETPPSPAPLNHFSNTGSGPKPNDLFVNLDGANVGFKHWHPIPVTNAENKLSGQGDMGGGWEWTSSVFEKYPGFEPMPQYLAYSVDFFDGKHNIVLGGSWATHPKVAGRKTFVNWYQRNYPYAWAGARLVRDL